MKKSKLIRLLRTFNQKEINEFHKYLMYFYKDYEIATTLFNHLSKFHPNYDHRKIEKEYIAEKFSLYDYKNPYKRISNEAHKLYTWLEDFLVWKKISSNEEEYSQIKERVLLKVYRERHLEDLFFRGIEKSQKKTINSLSNIWQYSYLVELFHQLYYYTPTPKLSSDSLLQNADEYLDLFYIGLKLKYQCEFYSRRSILGEQTSGIQVDDGFFKYDHLVRGHVWHNLYMGVKSLISEPSLRRYENIKEAFLRNGSFIDEEDQYILVRYLLNYLSSVIREGDFWGLREAFDWYRYAIQNNLLTRENYITESTFINIVTIACQVYEFDWVENFIEEYNSLLQEDKKIHITNVAKAQLLFAKGQFRETISFLNKASFHDMDVHSQVISRYLLLRSFFELGEQQLVADHIEATRKFLQRNKLLSAINVKAGINFLKILQLLLDKKKNRNELMELVAREKVIFNKLWLHEKISNL